MLIFEVHNKSALCISKIRLYHCHSQPAASASHKPQMKRGYANKNKTE